MPSHTPSFITACCAPRAAGDFGQLCTGNENSTGIPVPWAANTTFDALAGGGTTVCGLEAGTGRALCCGGDAYGQLGLGGPAPASKDQVDGSARSATPVEVASGGRRWAQVVAGDTWACARTAEGEAFCWGKVRGLVGLADCLAGWLAG